MELIAKENKALKQVSESGDVVYALRVSTYNPESWVEVDIAEYNDWKLKQEEEERKLAEQYGMPYGEEVGNVKEERCRAWRICRHNWQYLRARCGGGSSMDDCYGVRGGG